MKNSKQNGLVTVSLTREQAATLQALLGGAAAPAAKAGRKADRKPIKHGVWHKDGKEACWGSDVAKLIAAAQDAIATAQEAIADAVREHEGLDAEHAVPVYLKAKQYGFMIDTD